MSATAPSADTPSGATSPGAGPELDPSGLVPADACIAMEDPGRCFGPAMADGRRRYVRVEHIGEGGLGEVWRAWDFNLSKWVAIKLLRGALAPADVEAFLEEGKLVSKLEHPGIVPVYDVGIHEGRPYLVMQLVVGESLARTPVTNRASEVARLVRDAARGLHHAHERGVLHQDVKPENILVAHAHGDGADRVLLADFGIARVLGGSLRRYMSEADRRGASLGTPEFMSPEQARSLAPASVPAGAADPIDQRTDVYGLGATMYALLAGRPPYSGPVDDVLRKAANERPQPIRALRPDCPRPLARIVEKAMARDPAARHPTAAALAADLDAFLRWGWARRLLRPLSWVAALLAVVAIAFLVVREVGYRRALAREAEHERALAWEEAVVAADEALSWKPGDTRARRTLAGARHRLGWFDPVHALAHPPLVEAIALSPDGKVVASGAKDGSVRVWDATTGALRAAFAGEDRGRVSALAFSGDGRTLAVSNGASLDIRLLDLAAARERARLPAQTSGGVRMVAWSLDGRWLAAAGPDPELRLWDASRLDAPPHLLRGHDEGAFALAFSPDASHLASAGPGTDVFLFDVPSATLARRFEGFTGIAWSAAFSGDGRTFAVGYSGNLVMLWDARTWERLGTIAQVDDAVQSVAFGRTGRLLAVADISGKAWLFDALGDKAPHWSPEPLSGDQLWSARADGRLLRLLEGHKPGLQSCLALSPDGETLATASRDGTIKVWSRRWTVAEPGPPLVPERPDALSAAAARSLAVDDDGGAVHLILAGGSRVEHASNRGGPFRIAPVPGVKGDEISFAVDPAGAGHLLFGTLHSSPVVASWLHHATNEGGTWRVVTVDDSDAGWGHSLAVDAEGAVHASYISGRGELRYARRDPVTRVFSVPVDVEVLPRDEIGPHTAVAVCPNEHVHIAYFVGKHGALRLRHAIQDAAGAWRLADLIPPGRLAISVPGRPAARVGADESVHLCYWDYPPKRRFKGLPLARERVLLHVHAAGDGWRAGAIAPGVAPGNDPPLWLTLDPAGAPRVRYLDLETGVLRCAFRRDGP